MWQTNIKGYSAPNMGFQPPLLALQLLVRLARAVSVCPDYMSVVRSAGGITCFDSNGRTWLICYFVTVGWFDFVRWWLAWPGDLWQPRISCDNLQCRSSAIALKSLSSTDFIYEYPVLGICRGLEVLVVATVVLFPLPVKSWWDLWFIDASVSAIGHSVKLLPPCQNRRTQLS